MLVDFTFACPNLDCGWTDAEPEGVWGRDSEETGTPERIEVTYSSYKLDHRSMIGRKMNKVRLPKRKGDYEHDGNNIEICAPEINLRGGMVFTCRYCGEPAVFEVFVPGEYERLFPKIKKKMRMGNMYVYKDALIKKDHVKRRRK